MDGTNGTSRNNGRSRGVADGIQVSKHLVESHADVTSNIFSKHPTGSCGLNNPAHFWPEMASIFFAASFPGSTERLARVSAGNKVNSSIIVWFESSHIVMYRSAWEVLGEDLPRPWVYLAECRRFDSAHHLSRKRKAANPTEQIKMHNKTLHGMPMSILREFGR
jgi:hypothetical protein